MQQRFSNTFRFMLAGALALPLPALAHDHGFERGRDHAFEHGERGVPVIFVDAGFAGARQPLAPGRYDIGQLAIGNDQLSSLQVPPGWRVTLYEHGGFGGRSRTFTTDTPWVGNDFNDITSSIVVEGPAPRMEQPPSREQPVVIYRDGSFAGPSQELWPGRFDTEQIAIGNDQLSSLRVPPGLVVTLFEHSHWQGRSRQFQSDTPWVGNDFNDITSSILIERAGPERSGPRRFEEHRRDEHYGDEQPPPAPPREPEELTGANLHLAHRHWRGNDPIVLDYFNMPSGDNMAWVTVVPRGAPDGEWGTWAYTSGAATGSFSVGTLAPGEYEARAFPGGAGAPPLDRVEFRVVR